MQTPTLVEKATWSPQSIAATLWSFPSGPERRTSRLFCAPGPNLLQGEVIKKLIISNEELVIGPEEMTVSSTLRSPKALGDWEAPNCIHMGAGDFLSSRWQGLTAVQETLTIRKHICVLFIILTLSIHLEKIYFCKLTYALFTSLLDYWNSFYTGLDKSSL